MPSRVSVPAIVALLLTGCAAKQQQAPYLQSALHAARWIQAGDEATEAGKTWPPDPQKPDEPATNLYSGPGGVVLFFLEAYPSTGDSQLLADARAGADHLLSSIPPDLGPEDAGLVRLRGLTVAGKQANVGPAPDARLSASKAVTPGR